jgi:hypothetical protein
VSPWRLDTGRAKLAGKFAEMIGGGWSSSTGAPGHNRRSHRRIGDVARQGRSMTDDIIDTAGTPVPAPRRCARLARTRSPAPRTRSSTIRARANCGERFGA